MQTKDELIELAILAERDGRWGNAEELWAQVIKEQRERACETVGGKINLEYYRNRRDYCKTGVERRWRGGKT